MATINFGGVKENVVTRSEFSLAKARQVLKNEVIAIIGYGVQGPAQAFNLRDNGFKVIVGNRKGGKGWTHARADKVDTAEPADAVEGADLIVGVGEGVFGHACFETRSNERSSA